jgi:hypothetical protein
MRGVFRPPPFHPSRPTLVGPVRLDPEGRVGPTTAQARGAGWRRSSRGRYVPADVDADDPAQRIIEAAAVLPAYGGVTGWAALHWWGGHWFDGRAWGSRHRRDVWLATGDIHIREQPGISICEEKLDPRDLTVVDGLRVTTALRSALFEMRYAASERLAVVAMDMVAYSDLVSIAEMREYAAAHSSWTGIPQARDALPHADENAWSPPEVLMRLSWTFDAGRPRPLCNAPIFDPAGRHIGTPDLLDAHAGVVGEYDGALHLLGRQRARDVRREADFRSVGLEYVTMLAADLLDPSHFVGRLHAAYRRAGYEPESGRAWTIARPAWWTSTDTVARRRVLTDAQRARLLRRRAS